MTVKVEESMNKEEGAAAVSTKGGAKASRKGRTNVHVYPDWCKGCGICVAFCPSNVFEMDGAGKAVAARESDCVNCGFCELHCPDFAIKITPKDAVGPNGVVKPKN